MPLKERLELTLRLAESLPSEEAHLLETERRAQELQQGTVKALSGQEIFARLDDLHQKYGA